MIGFHPFLEVHISPMVRQRITCTTLSFMPYPFLLFIHFLHLARQHRQWRQEFLCFLQESNAPQQRKNSAKAYVLRRALKNLSNSKPNNKNSGAAPPLCCDPAFIRNFRKNLKNSPNNASQTYIWPHLTAFRVFLRHFRLICLHS